jgi:hypothetical protein
MNVIALIFTGAPFASKTTNLFGRGFLSHDGLCDGAPSSLIWMLLSRSQRGRRTRKGDPALHLHCLNAARIRKEAREMSVCSGHLYLASKHNLKVTDRDG